MFVPCAELCPGQVLAAELLDAGGQRLLAAGTVLDAATIALLARREVPGADVVDVAELARERCARREQLVARTERRFRHAGSQPLMQTLHREALAFFLQSSGLDD
ncbi:MAG: hypothetical protein HY749_10635 [Gammaproteobacteria bacterium]|nr:hypothetical protein [Gammaproteobacteria bacterium]